MKKVISALSLAGATLVYASAASSLDVAEDSFIVLWETAADQKAKSLSSFASGLSVSRYKHVGPIDVVHLDNPDDRKKYMANMAELPGVRGVYPNQRYSALQLSSQAVDVDDPLFSSLWGLDNDDGFDINAPEAWDVSTGSSDVAVMVIDTGIDYTHTDLASNMWVNPDEIAGNGIDDDNNGWVDDIYGIDTVNGDGDPMDDQEHGTHVAGTIAAVGNNDEGVVGVTWNTQLIACKFLDEFGSGTEQGAIDCLEYALSLKRDKGVPIVATNNSWGGGFFSQPLYEAIEAHLAEDMLFVAAAGNSSSNNDVLPAYPASYDHQHIISVAASSRSGQLAYFSNYGSESVDIVAPGDEILSTTPGDNYSSFSGTSMASPHVAGAVALVKAAQPELSGAGIKSLLLGTAVPSDLNHGRVLTGDLLLWGEGDSGAVNCEDFISVQRHQPVSNQTRFAIGSTFTIAMSAYDCGTPTDSPSVTGPDGVVVLNDNGEEGDAVAGDGVFSAELTVDWSGTISFSVEESPELSFEVTAAEIPEVVETQYSYIEIDGTEVFLSDDDAEYVDLGFDVLLPGDIGISTIGIESNGTLSFDGNYYGLSGSPFPLSGEADVLAMYWEDLYPNSATTVSYEVLGESPNRQLVVDYENIGFYGSFGTSDDYTVSFQVVMSESTPDIIVNYKDVQAEFAAGRGFGGRASIGMQLGLDGVQYSYREEALRDQMSLLYSTSAGERPVITEFMVDGLLRPNQVQAVSLDAITTRDDVTLSATVAVDGGEPIVITLAGDAVEVSLEEGSHTIQAAVTDGEFTSYSTRSVFIEPFSDAELLLIDQASEAARDEVLASPNDFGLFSQAQYDESFEMGQQAVVASPSDFGLYTQAELDQASLNARNAALAEVAEAPSLFGYVTVVQNTLDQTNAAQEATDGVVADPQPHGLTYIVNSAEDIAALPEGVHLVGMSIDVDDMASFFADVKYVWAYRDGAYVGYVGPNQEDAAAVTEAGFAVLESLTAGEGVWVSK